MGKIYLPKFVYVLFIDYGNKTRRWSFTDRRSAEIERRQALKKGYGVSRIRKQLTLVRKV